MINFQAGAGQVCKFILINSFVLINAEEQSVGIQHSISRSYFERNHQAFLCPGPTRHDCLLGRSTEPSKTPCLLLSLLVLASLITAIKSTACTEVGHNIGLVQAMESGYLD